MLSEKPPTECASQRLLRHGLSMTMALRIGMFHWTRWWHVNQTIGFTLIKPYWTLVFVGGYVGVGGCTGHEPMNCQGHQCLKHKMLQVIMHTSSSVWFFQEMGVLVLRTPPKKTSLFVLLAGTLGSKKYHPIGPNMEKDSCSIAYV